MAQQPPPGREELLPEPTQVEPAFKGEMIGGSRGGTTAFLISIVLDTVAPYVLYQVLANQNVPTITALSLTAIFPVLGILINAMRTRHADAIGIASLAIIVVGVASNLLFGDPRFFLIKDSFVSGTLALICLVSLVLLPRPAMFYVGRSLLTQGDPERLRNYDTLWRYAYFRFTQRLVTVVWGVTYLAEALIRIALVDFIGTSRQDIAEILAISPILLGGTTGLAFLWTIWYVRHSIRKGERMSAEP